MNVLLSDLPGRDALLDDLASIETVDRLATRRIFQAIRSARAAGAPVAFDAIVARLGAEDGNLLAGLALSEDADTMEVSVEYGYQCLESLRQSDQRDRRARMKARIREAERAGNIAEAMQLAKELQVAERSAEAAHDISPGN